MENNEEEIVAKQIYKQWSAHTDYLYSKNFPNVYRESVEFYEGKHWNKKTQQLGIPQVTYNIIKMIIDSKASNILSTPFTTHYRSSETTSELVDMFNKFDMFICSELNHELINRKLVNDGLIKGTFAIHYYWDEDLLGQRGLYKGGLQAEVIDPLLICVSNPKEKDIQKQKYIIIPTKVDLKTAKAMCQFEEKKDLIVSDDELNALDNEYIPTSDKASELVTVFTKYFRIDGDVYFQKSTKNVVLTPPIPENPILKARELEKNEEFQTDIDDEYYKIDEARADTPDEADESYEEEEKFYLYPIEMGSLTPSDKSIYGLSDVYPIIMAQKMLNIYFSTIYKKSLDDVFPKWIVKKGALQQDITGEPNEIIIDNTVGSGFGITKVEGSVYSNGQLALADTITEFAKMVSNSRDVLQGDSVGANMSAIAIQSLQAQAEKPIAQQREGFMFSLRKMARIRAQFYKFYYEEKSFAYEMDEIEYENQLETNGFDKNSVNRTVNATFNGTDFRNTPILVQVDVGRGTKFDAITAQETVNNLLLNGTIDKMDSDKLELWISMTDDNIMPYKDKLRAIMRKQRQSEKAQLQGMVEQLTQQAQQQQMQLQQQQMYIEQLTNEFKTKVEVQNEKMKQLENAYNGANDTIYKLYSTLQGTPDKVSNSSNASPTSEPTTT